MSFGVTDVVLVGLSPLVQGLHFDRHSEDGNQFVKASHSQRNGSCKQDQDTANKQEYLSLHHAHILGLNPKMEFRNDKFTSLRPHDSNAK